MINLKFEVNDTFLASYLITRTDPKKYISKSTSLKDRTDIVNFQNKAWETSRDLNDIIRGQIPFSYMLLPKQNISNYKDLGSKINAFLEEIFVTKEYKTIKDQTLETLDLCKNEWEKNYSEMQKYINKIGINLLGEYKVWFVHPGMTAGHYFGNNNLCWSYQTYWPNYNTVYLWHEILHSYFGRNDYEHTLIELITDDHMRFLLNGTEYPPFEGHDSLADFKKEVFPIWKKYVDSKDKNIENLVEEFKVAYGKFNR